jgi:hypothetical protein
VAEVDSADSGVWTAPESGSDTVEQARLAWIMALTAGVLTMSSPCLSFPPLFAALPLAVMALLRARRILATSPDGVIEVYARTAWILGIASLVVSSLLLTFLLLVILFYVGLAAMVLLSEVQ